MLLILEIGLTIAAWRRGWKSRALLPLAIAVGVGFMAGIFIGIAGGSTGEALVICTLLDVVCIGVLTGMVVKPRQAEKPLPTTDQPLQNVESSSPKY